MKNAQSPKSTPVAPVRKHVENKDNLDSRHKEEQMVKEDHITSNEKRVRAQESV